MLLPAVAGVTTIDAAPLPLEVVVEVVTEKIIEEVVVREVETVLLLVANEGKAITIAADVMVRRLA